MDVETVQRGFQWWEVAVGLWGVISVAANVTPTKKDDEIVTKADKVFNLVSAIGLDLKVVKRVLFPDTK